MKKTRPEFRPATVEDYKDFYGHPPSHTMRAYVVTLDKVPVAIGGTLCSCGIIYVFADMKEELRPYKVSIMKFASKIDEILDGAPGVALANPNEPGAERFLQWLGFEHVAPSDAGEVYRWTRKRRNQSA